MMVEGPFSVFMFLSVGAVALYSFLAVASWSSSRQKERESYYKNEMLKKMAESSSEGATAVTTLLREEARATSLRRRAGLRIGGLVTAAVGISLLIFLRALVRDQPIYLCGLIPLLVGFALYVSSYIIHTDGQ
jgi:Na+-transporting methylmalonyl-CoA/oxaloacetate decarboxylase gamma subunit